MLIEPYVPFTVAATFPLALGTVPAATPVTVFVSPASGSVSLVSTFPVGFVPALLLLMPPASTAMALSLAAVGESLTAVTLIEAVALLVEKAVVPPALAVEA